MISLRLPLLRVTFLVASTCLLSSGCSQSVVNDYGPGAEGIEVSADSGHLLLGDWVRMDDESHGAVIRFEDSEDGLTGVLVYPGNNLTSYGFETGHIKIRDLQATDETATWRCRSRVHSGGWGRCDRFWFDDVRLELQEGQFFLRGADALESQRWTRIDAQSPSFAHLLYGLCELAQQRSDNRLQADAAKLLVSEKQSLTAAELNELAWDLATASDPEARHPELAVTLAKEACRKDGFNEGNYVDTLAAAYAAVGKWDQAVKYQQQACEDGWVDGADTRLRLYRQKRAYVQGMYTGPQTAGGGSVPGSL